MRASLFGTLAGGGGTPLDPNAQAFITAAGITDPTQITAINDLVVGLKADSLWTVFDAIYPIVGGSATSHKFNLVNPADTDVAFRITFNGGWTHSATGALPNGSTGYANTHLAGSDLLDGDSHYALYSRSAYTDGGAAKFDLGALTSSAGPQLICCTSVLGGVQILGDLGARASGTVADGLGLFTVSRTGNTSLTAYRNASSTGTAAGAETPLISTITNPYYIGARDFNGSANSFSTREVAFASFGVGLSGTDVTNYYALVQAFQTALSRQV